MSDKCLTNLYFSASGGKAHRLEEVDSRANTRTSCTWSGKSRVSLCAEKNLAQDKNRFAKKSLGLESV